MYYNIKIKSNGSEFILESNNKTVTQKEMDIYFAHIFGASEEFNSKLDENRVENKENLKSIYEIENLAFEENVNKIVEENSPIIEKSEIKQEHALVTSKIEKEIQKEPEIIEEPRIRTNESISFVNESPKESPFEEFDNFLSTEKSIEIEKLYKNTTQQDKNVERLNEIFSKEEPPENKVEEISPIVTEDKSMREIIQETIAQGSIMPDIEIEPILKETENGEEKIYHLDDIVSENKEFTPFDLNQTQANTLTEPIAKIQSELGDFEEFLKSVKETNNLEDEFIICAYYIKNILNQNNFTMKFINSKLFQFCGKIADMSIVDELISKDYIRLVAQTEFKLYSITHQGEEYFRANFRE